MKSSFYTGQQPKSNFLKGVLQDEILFNCNLDFFEDEVIVHHITDIKDCLQVEYEIRFYDGNIRFGRIKL